MCHCLYFLQFVVTLVFKGALDYTIHSLKQKKVAWNPFPKHIKTSKLGEGSDSDISILKRYYHYDYDDVHNNYEYKFKICL